ncbi:MAG: 4'-phosphopantetheinyl transferase superfamily protein [Bacteroidales bacterium]|nr:4'-phosphopantetheinyl transferase superfamily protein [Bacteroidales bacterium]MBN2820708.1 4'-phosphopantetheinyl transferase superfamily protein [Bacteroidales bacterium]
MKADINKIQQVVSKFLPSGTVLSENTSIDNSVIQGSVKLHLMYGELADMGYKIDDFTVISTFGDLLNTINGISTITKSVKQSESVNIGSADALNKQVITGNIGDNLNVGIDIIKIVQLPVVDDYRENSFYTENFSQEEISYCLLKSSPIHSFAGKFAAKEAIVKSDSSFKGKPFKDIQIKYNTFMQPYFGNFSLSISHDEEYAVAIAIKNENHLAGSKNDEIRAIQKNFESKVNKKEIELEKLIKKAGSKKNNIWVIISLVLNIGIIAFLLYNYLILKTK